MTKQEMIKVAEEIQDLTAFLEEVKAEIETKQDLLKAQMVADGLEVLDLDTFYVRWLPVISNRLDSTKMKKDLPDPVSGICAALPVQQPLPGAV